MRKLLLITVVFIYFLQDVSAQGRLPYLIPYRKDSLWGYCDSNKKVVITPQFSVAPLVEWVNFNLWHEPVQVALVKKNDAAGELCGLINMQGKILLPCEYDRIGFWNDTTAHLVAVKGSNYYTVNGHTGTTEPYSDPSFSGYPNLFYESAPFERIAEIVDEASAIINGGQDNFIIIQRNRKWGIQSNNKKDLVKPVYDTVWSAGNDVFILKKANYYGLVVPGKKSTPIIYQEIRRTSDGYNFTVKRNNRWGVLINDWKTEVLLGDKPCSEVGELSVYRLTAVIDASGKFLGYIDYKGKKYWE
ncbi:MAG: WG repeat-containing protein [Ferruginibacter sp.]